MPRVVATNVRLREDRYRALKRRALTERKSCAQVVREAIDQHLGLCDPAEDAVAREDPLLDLIGFVTSGEPAGSIDHDHDLYGWPKESDEKAVRRHRSVAGHRRSR